MPVKTFIVDYYRTRMGFKQSATFSGTRADIQGHIVCHGDHHRFIIYFVHPDSPTPQPYFHPSIKIGTIFLPFAHMTSYLDMLRNEKPIYAYLNSSKPEWNCLRTSNEPVGEEES